MKIQQLGQITQGVQMDGAVVPPIQSPISTPPVFESADKLVVDYHPPDSSIYITGPIEKNIDHSVNLRCDRQRYNFRGNRQMLHRQHAGRQFGRH